MTIIQRQYCVVETSKQRSNTKQRLCLYLEFELFVNEYFGM